MLFQKIWEVRMGRNMLECGIICLRLKGGQENGRWDSKRCKGRESGGQLALSLFPFHIIYCLLISRQSLFLLWLCYLVPTSLSQLLLLFPFCKYTETQGDPMAFSGHTSSEWLNWVWTQSQCYLFNPVTADPWGGYQHCHLTDEGTEAQGG